jgi:hypothetical protein
VQSEHRDARAPLEGHELEHGVVEPEHDHDLRERLADAILDGRTGATKWASHAEKVT